MEYEPFKMKATTAGYSTPFQKNYGIGLPEGGVSPMQFDWNLKSIKKKVGEYAEKGKSFVKKHADLDALQDALAIGGLTPAGGIIPDFLNTVISGGRMLGAGLKGDWKGVKKHAGTGALNLAAAVPIAGQFVTGAKFGVRGAKNLKLAKNIISKDKAKKAFVTGTRFTHRGVKHLSKADDVSGIFNIFGDKESEQKNVTQNLQRAQDKITNRVKAKGVMDIPSGNKRQTYAAVWKNMPDEEKKKHGTYTKFKDAAKAWNKRQVT